MTNVLLISAQEGFDLPLAEAARKQILYRAMTLAEDGKKPSILIVTPDQERSFEHEGIAIQLITRRAVHRKRWLIRESDQIEYWGTTGLVALKIGMLSRAGKKSLVVTDGGVVSTGARRKMRGMAAPRMAAFYDEFLCFTEYQRKQLERLLPERHWSQIRSIRPVVEPLKRLPLERSEYPVVLYMGHLSRFKGVDLLLKLLEDLLDEQPNLRLVLCDNGLSYDEECERLVRDTARRLPENLIIKGKIDPYHELARAHILIHPIRQAEGTFAFPMALWEAAAIGTPFISSRVGGLPEFFDDDFLISPDDYLGLLALTRGMLLNPESARERTRANFRSLADKVQQLGVSITAGASSPADQEVGGEG